MLRTYQGPTLKEPEPVKLPDASTHNPAPDYAGRLMELTGIEQKPLAERLGVSARSLRCYKDAGPSHIPMPYTVQYALERLADARRRSHRSRPRAADRVGDTSRGSA